MTYRPSESELRLFFSNMNKILKKNRPINKWWHRRNTHAHTRARMHKTTTRLSYMVTITLCRHILSFNSYLYTPPPPSNSTPPPNKLSHTTSLNLQHYHFNSPKTNARDEHFIIVFVMRRDNATVKRCKLILHR